MEDILHRTKAMELEMTNRPISPDIVPSAPESPVTMGEELIIMELPRLE